jgi:anti-anti-sigma factor
MTTVSDIAINAVQELPGNIAVVEERGVRVIRLSGQIDSYVVAAYERSRLALADRSHPANVIDASAVTFLDGRGLAFLVRQTQACLSAGARPILRSPGRVVRRLVDPTDPAQFTTAV